MPTMDSYAAMLLTLAFSPDKEEYARPLSTAEYREVCELTCASSIGSIGKLGKTDISGIMLSLGITEEYAYRIYTLMNRQVQLSYAVERYLARGISIITEHDGDYPAKPKRRAGLAAPAAMYVCGDAAALNKPSIGILGMSGVKTADGVRETISALVSFAARNGYRIIAGGELGVSRVAETCALELGCDYTCVVAGGMNEYMDRPEIVRMLKNGKLTIVSLEHPDALFTIPHAISRNKLLMSLAESVFIFNTDLKRGESDALRGKYCEFTYAWSGYPENKQLISKGAEPLDRALDVDEIAEMSKLWQMSRVEQLSIFDFDA